MFRAEFVDLLRLPDALEQQFGTQLFLANAWTPWSGDAVPAYPMVTVPKRNFLSWRSVTFPGRGASNKILAHSRVAAKSLPHTMKRSSNCSMVMFLLKTGMIVMYI